MTQKSIIRFLTIISLVIFFLPFFQTCSDKNIKEGRFISNSYSKAKTSEEKSIAFHQTKDSFSLTGYDLAMSFEPLFSGFTFIMILNITLCVCVFRSHYNQLFLCFLNLFVIITSFIILIFALPGFGQIRYGMYLCVINSILLFYLVYKEQENGI